MPDDSPLKRITKLFHFTDTRNLESIRAQQGLLPMAALRRAGVAIVAPGGNDWSRDADNRFGLDQYVHLCFLNEHPMEHVARQEGRIIDSVFLEISPAVLHIPGVLFTQEVSNKSGAARFPLNEACELIDFEVIYERTDWRDPAIQARRQAARKCEILVPGKIAIEMIRNLPDG